MRVQLCVRDVCVCVVYVGLERCGAHAKLRVLPWPFMVSRTCWCVCGWAVLFIVVLCVCVCVVCQTDGFTPLYAASHNGHVEVVKALVGAGAAVNHDVREDLVFEYASMCGVWIIACSCSCVCVMCA